MSGVEKGNRKNSGVSVPIWGIAVSMMTAALWLVFFQAAFEKNVLVVQRIGVLYWASVVTAAAAFFLVMVCSARYLMTQQRLWDRRAYAAAEIGMLFGTIALATGPFWVQSGWRLWWIWDERFTTISALWGLAGMYLLIRKYAAERAARMFSAILGLLIFWLLLATYWGMHWWQTFHPTALRIEGWGAASVAPGMPLLLGVCSFLVLFAYLFQQRVATEAMKDDLEGIRRVFLGQEQQRRDVRIENQDFIVEGYTFKEYRKYE